MATDAIRGYAMAASAVDGTIGVLMRTPLKRRPFGRHCRSATDGTCEVQLMALVSAMDGTLSAALRSAIIVTTCAMTAPAKYT